MKVLVTGATGLIGKELGKRLAEKGHEVFVVSRDVHRAQENLPYPCQVISGDLTKESLRDERLQSIEGVINLMGEPIFGERWTEQKKKRIYDSRVQGTKNLIASLSPNVKVFVSGSAIGYYGDCGDEVLKEDHAPGTDFLAQLCVDWENAASQAPGRKVFVRTSVVLAPRGGALEQMLVPFRTGVGGPLGDGCQWMSWIHIDDIVGLLCHALESSQVVGAINAAAPHPVINRDFSRSLAQALGKSMGPSVPTFVLKTIFGEMSSFILASERTSPEKVLASGYEFRFHDLDEALGQICAPYKNGEEVFQVEQFIPYPPEKVFPFFQNAHNLEAMTPPSLNFAIKNISTKSVQQGTLIDYDLKIRGIGVRWQSEIDEWQPPYRFVDNQLRGPYKLWRHTHEFRPFCGGTLMVDRVRYRLPLGVFGWMAGRAFVKKDVEDIFSFRRKYVASYKWN